MDGVSQEHHILAERMGEAGMRRRMDQENHEVQSKGLFRFEHVLPLPSIITHCMKACGLYDRGHGNFLELRVVENVVHLPSLPDAFDGYRILHIADLHADLDPEFPDVVISRLRGLPYDLCVNTGDYVNFVPARISDDLGPTRKIYEHVHGPCYAVFGNHDFLELLPGLEAMGIRMLMNESVAIERDGATLWLSGIDDAHFHQSHDVARARAAIPDDALSVMLSHTPATYKEVAAAGYDFMLSGHTHGGQLCLPGGVALTGHCKAPRAFWKGPWAYDNLKGYTSPGTGAGCIPLRFNCPPELTVHVLKKVTK